MRSVGRADAIHVDACLYPLFGFFSQTGGPFSDGFKGKQKETSYKLGPPILRNTCVILFARLSTSQLVPSFQCDLAVSLAKVALDGMQGMHVDWELCAHLSCKDATI